MKKYIMVIDEGTTGTRALIYNKNFEIIAQSYIEFTQYTPAEDKVEHDAMEIYEKTIHMCKNAMESSGVKAEDIASIGITNQRATCVVWNKITGIPLCHAIVWQDVRTSKECDEINKTEWGEKARRATGWTVSHVYTSIMVKWLLENNNDVKTAVDNGDALIGTIDTWLIWNLTGRQVHAVSCSNASVMGCYNLKENRWYTEFLDYLGVPETVLPAVYSDSGYFGTTYPSLFGAPISINSAIADQHAALFAEGCLEAGTGKITNGTGSFLDINIGDKFVVSNEGLNTVIAWKIKDKIMYALEGYESVTGSAVQWLRDGLKIIKNSSESETLACSVEDSNGVIVVPALAGLSAPFHDSYARGSIFGINRGTTGAHIARATLEGIVYRLKDILNAVQNESNVDLQNIRIDGGASKNDFLAQTMSDMLNVKVERPGSVEATSLGAAELAGLDVGFWTLEDFRNAITIDKIFEPKIAEKERIDRYEIWLRAIESCIRIGKTSK